jgi:hypothetical protein
VAAGIAFFIVENKIDLEDELPVGDVKARPFAAAHGAQPFKVSAATGAGSTHFSTGSRTFRRMEAWTELQRDGQKI